jgi:aryl-alcohol dehydrogenase-like predicted oxidoreductase
MAAERRSATCNRRFPITSARRVEACYDAASAISTPLRVLWFRPVRTSPGRGCATRSAPSCARPRWAPAQTGDLAIPDHGQFKHALPFAEVYDYSYDGVMRSVEDSLHRLGTWRIDVLLVHDLDVWTHRSEDARRARVEEFMAGGYRAMVKLRAQGAVRAIGAGINETAACQDLAERGDFDCFLLAGRYTLLEQEPLDELLPLCERRNIALIIGGAYNTGILATGAVEGAYFSMRRRPRGSWRGYAGSRWCARGMACACRPRRCSSRSATPRWRR